MLGRINSFQSMGAVDGPGLRFVVFMQGCPLRCAYCHNPDTWDFQGGSEFTVDAVVSKILRYKSYIAKKGGVTVTGGEPLMQSEFVAELFSELHKHGIHTALDTSGMIYDDKVKEVLTHTDLVMCDIKFLSNEDYQKYVGTDFDNVLSFLKLTSDMNIPLWVRHVVVPGITDGDDHIRKLGTLCKSFQNFEHLELLPFRKLCLPKYQNLGLEFPLNDTPEMKVSEIERLYKLV